MKRLIATLALATVALAAAACASGGGAPAVTGSVDPNAVKVTAKDIKFTTSDVAAPAGAAFQVSFDNEDGAPHNVAIVDGSGKEQFKGEIFGGPATKTYQVPALPAGTYQLRCDVHPDMKATLTVR